MKLQYCSDLHLEFRENREFIKENPLQVKGDILLLAGDITPFATMDKYNFFLISLVTIFSTLIGSLVITNTIIPMRSIEVVR